MENFIFWVVFDSFMNSLFMTFGNNTSNVNVGPCQTSMMELFAKIVKY